MAACTVVDDARVIEDAFGEVVGVVANTAIRRGGNVDVRLARCVGAIVAGCAVAGNGAVIERRIGKADGVAMASVALFIGGNMIDIFTGCDDAVVAPAAVAGDARVIIGTVGCCGHEFFGVVAGIALGGRRFMEDGLADRDDAIVTTAAGSEYFLVINERYLGKTHHGVTPLASVAGGQMIA